MKITIDDVRATGLCVSGARDFAKTHGINFRDFVRNGVDSAVLLATGDGYAQRVIDRKLGRNGRR